MNIKDSEIFYYLITQSGFCDWVRKPNRGSNYFWRRWMEEHPDNIPDVKKACEFVQRMHFRREQLSPGELGELLGKVMALEESGKKPIAKTANLWAFFNQPVRVAAILLLSVVAVVALLEGTRETQDQTTEIKREWVTLENPKGRKSKITLPDGTLVNLSYESQLRFPVAFDGKVRRVELVGEAFFEVVGNDSVPFFVKTGTVETEVLGTSFNIRSYKEELRTEVSLVTGKVKIIKKHKHPEHTEYLIPGEQLSYNKNSGEMAIQPFDQENVLAWKDGLILFEDAGFDEFVDKLERWYGVDFKVYGTPSRKWKVNGRYQDQKLDDILTGVDFVYGLDYKIQGRTVILKFK